MATVVDFAEGILGIGNSRNEVAKCLKRESYNQDFQTSLRMCIVANCLEAGLRVDMKILHQIGEKPLADTQRLFLNAEKEKSSS